MADAFENTKYITGIKAYSALAVFLHHNGTCFKRISPFINKFVCFGQLGVISFFLLSSFTMCMSIQRNIQRNKKFVFFEYLASRFFKIAPLYYLTCIIALLAGGRPYYLNMFKVENGFINLLYHVSFLNMFDVRYQNCLIGVEWVLPIFMGYYLILPPIFCFVRDNDKRLFFVVIIAFIISIFSPRIFAPFYNQAHPELSNHFSLEKYAFTYVLGIVSYKIFLSEFALNIGKNDYMLIIHIIILGLYINFSELFTPFPPFISQVMCTTFWTFCLLIICRGRTLLVRLFFENKAIIWLGKMSFSIYLLHFFVTDVGFGFARNVLRTNPYYAFIFRFIITLVASHFAYKYIEKPFNNFRGKLRWAGLLRSDFHLY